MAERRELRVAPVMTGGTSLAVWMGGVTRELFAMVRAGDDPSSLYGQLLALTETTPVVDVITGTSAGGLNGSLLAAGLAFGVTTEQFDTIRQTWMDAADLEQLLREPKELDPPSLLRGQYFVDQITAVLTQWRPPTQREPAADVDLVTTYTAVNPQPVYRRDSFGSDMNEVVHAGTLRFHADHFSRPDVVDRLALASRTSAGIPGVFEPTYLDGATFAPHFGPRDHQGGRWAVDGGVVVNLPLGEALDRIFEREATTDVRRVILYVCPTPRERTDPDVESVATMPPLARSVATVVSAPRAEGVANDLTLIADNNDRVRRQRSLRRSIGTISRALMPPLLSQGDLMTHYRRLRAEQSIDQMLGRLREDGGGLMRDEAAIREGLRLPRESLLPTSVGLFRGGGQDWGWGIASVQQAVSCGLGVVNATIELLSWLPDDRPVDRAALMRAKAAIHRARQTARRIRRLDAEYWRASADLGAATSDTATLVELGFQLYRNWPYLPTDPDAWRRSAVFALLLRAHRRVAAALIDIAPIAGDVVGLFGAGDPTTTAVTAAPAHVSELANDVHQELFGVYLATTASPPAVQRQLLIAHVAQTLFLGNVADREQPAELMQVSWTAPNFLDPDRLAHQKLVGTELARLGAFLKPSWRANDWFWGRMDGAARLVQLLLDPTRLRQLRRRPADVLTALDIERTAELDEELRFLVDWSITAPDSLPALTRAVGLRLQLAIARSELGPIRDAVVDHAEDTIEQDRGRFTEAFDRAHRDGPPDDATITELVGAMRVGEETVRDEFGSNLTLRIATRAAGVSVNSLTGSGTGIPVAPRLLRPLRGPLQGTNAIVGVLAGGSPLARALTAFLIAVSGAIVAVRVAGVDVNPVVLTLAVLTFAITGAVSLLRARGRRSMAAGWVAFAAVVGFVLLGPSLSAFLFDRTAPTPIGSLHSGDLIVVTDPGTIRVIDGTGDDALVDDITLAAGSRVELRDVGRTDLARAVELQDSTWKRVGFTNRFSVVNVAAVALGAFLLLRRERRASLGWLVTATVLIGAAVVNALAQPLDHMMTGADPGPGGGGSKRVAVDVAAWLHDQRVGLLVVLFVAVGVVISAVWRPRARRR